MVEPMAVMSWLNHVTPDQCTITWQDYYQYETAQARNLAVTQAIQDDYDYVWQIDSDCVIPAFALDLMLELKQPFTTGCYVKKQDQRQYELYDWINQQYVPWRELTDQPQPVSACGMGCFLADVGVLADMSPPWFVNTQHQNGWTEDLYFCNQLHRLGHTVWMHPGVQLQHVGRKIWR
jgi:hypothetical protein